MGAYNCRRPNLQCITCGGSGCLFVCKPWCRKTNCKSQKFFDCIKLALPQLKIRSLPLSSLELLDFLPFLYICAIIFPLKETSREKRKNKKVRQAENFSIIFFSKKYCFLVYFSQRFFTFKSGGHEKNISQIYFDYLSSFLLIS